MSTVALGDLAVEHFEPLLTQLFTVSWPEGTERLTLVSIDRFHDEPGRPRTPFTLNFDGTTPGLLLHQQIHPLEHPVLGVQDLFLVPVGQNAEGIFSYQVAFA